MIFPFGKVNEYNVGFYLSATGLAIFSNMSSCLVAWSKTFWNLNKSNTNKDVISDAHLDMRQVRPHIYDLVYYKHDMKYLKHPGLNPVTHGKTE